MTTFIVAEQIDEAAAAISGRTHYQSTVGLVLGSGLSTLAEAIESPDVIPYQEIPHWPVSTVAGHSGRVVIGRLAGQTLVVLQGRAHYYEGYSMSHLTLPIRVLQRLGVRTLIVTNAAGGINANFRPGDLMLIKDHINLLGIAGLNPLRGPNDDAAGPRFPDMTAPYDPALRELAHQVAADAGFTLQEGVYAYVAGPSYETPAELRFLRTIGADAVGMSTIPEVVVARHGGLRVLGVSTITNLALPDPLPGQKLTHEEVLETGRRILPRLTELLHGILRKL